MTAVLRPGPTGLYTEHDVEFCPELRAAGHNPHGLIVAQVGAGWRLLAREEIIDGMRSPEDRLAIEMRDSGGWSADWNGNSVGDTYRTKKPPGYYMPFESEVRKFAKNEKVRKKLTELSATDAEATPPPAGAKYVHTFVCNGCKLGCTVELVTETPTTKTEPDRCLFVGSAPWHLEATHTLTP